MTASEMSSVMIELSLAFAGGILVMHLVRCLALRFQRWRLGKRPKLTDVVAQSGRVDFPWQYDHTCNSGISSRVDFHGEHKEANWPVMTPSNIPKTAFGARGGNKISEPSPQTRAPPVFYRK
ncbi:hypothetical protein KC19_7G054000 [Ceratodon purpureus]|uniref:Uncharacterized protein n=1 Tax=Ceratodon purpureus TaxID=3225 RepID=A0A8T0H7W0_CERPU|nr:hypothetical protein KC19_7G054000 [Ceratodon purpureus]